VFSHCTSLSREKKRGRGGCGDFRVDDFSREIMGVGWAEVDAIFAAAISMAGGGGQALASLSDPLGVG
jgi:hypothetical protein